MAPIWFLYCVVYIDDIQYSTLVYYNSPGHFTRCVLEELVSNGVSGILIIAFT